MKINKQIMNSRDAFDMVVPYIHDEEQEHLTVVVLNAAQIAKSMHFISDGTDTSVLISAKMIARTAVMNNACGIIMAHNHPSGKVTPSKADIQMTAKVKEALAFFDISLLDHIIVGDGEYFSFSEETSHKIW